MKNFLALVGGLVLTLAVAGWYQGWYSIEKGPVAGKGKQNFQVEVSTQKIAEDTRDVGNAIRSLWTAKREPTGVSEEAEPAGPPPELMGPPRPVEDQ